MSITLVSRISLVGAALFGVLLVACSADSAGASNDEPGATVSPTNPALGGSTPSKSSDGSCSTPLATRSCCTDGTQTCSGGEFLSWGPCLAKSGAPASCEPEAKPAGTDGGTTPGTDGGPDAGKGSSASACVGGMVCKPGAMRYCDTPVAEWTKSVCSPAGQWGPCLAATAPKGTGCDQNSYAPEKCCAGLGLCCQDNPNGPFRDFGTGACAATSCGP